MSGTKDKATQAAPSEEAIAANGAGQAADTPPEKFEIDAVVLMEVLHFFAQKPEVVLWEKLRSLKPMEAEQ